MPLTLDPARSIGDIAREHPLAIPVFDRFRIDYCCHGSDSFASACTKAKVEPAAVQSAVAEIETAAAQPATDWSTLSMSALCDQIESTHHAFARNIFLQLDQLLPRIVNRHGRHLSWLTELSAVVANLKEEILDHMIREERVLFPWLRRLEQHEAIHIGPPWSVKRPIDCMVHDHVAVAAAFDKIRTLTSDYALPECACASVEALLSTLRSLELDTRLHIHKENNILFPKGIRAEAARPAREAGPSACGCPSTHA